MKIDNCDDSIEMSCVNNQNGRNNSNEDYCCICLNTYDYIYNKLQCCQQTIHENCLIEWILSDNNVLYRCPICRNKININEKITIGKIIDYINTQEQCISKEKLQSILHSLYTNTNLRLLLLEENFSEDQSHDDRLQLINNVNNRLKGLIIFIVGICIMFIMIIFYTSASQNK